ncbi:transposase [Cyanobacterium aponinum AL20118]|uniref:Transposase n=1 Tax=Cyanobacterium aponinum AL20115 TaxID=3090662 RepID=A0AAF1C4Q0_9CHRO|nr:transposase [Cyanobacterium aponinum]WPF87581.1 transposase [Cyanobacterium aponinum AL20115]
MKLVQRHLIKPNNQFYQEIDKLTFLSKNLYNCGIYLCRQAFFKGEKIPSQNQLYHQLKGEIDYRLLPTKVSQLVLKQVEKTFKSYQSALKEYKQKPSKFTGKPSLPRYKDKVKGRNIVTYNYQAISVKSLKKGLVNPSKTNILIKTDIKEILEVRLIPKNRGVYLVEIVYEKPEKETIISDNSAYIDLGLNNLAVLTSNKKGFQPKLICGRALKSCNHYYNKRIAQLKSQLNNKQKTSKKIQSLTLKRNNKVDYYLHTASRYIINHLLENNISLLVIGQNKNWKQGMKLGKKNNQNFVNIPHDKLIQQLTYKAQLVGLKVITTKESYTSKCSFLDLEPVKKQEKYLGKRVKRGLFKASNGYVYSADVNGSLNIGRKVVGESVFDGDSIVRFVVNPLRVKSYKAS